MFQNNRLNEVTFTVRLRTIYGLQETIFPRLYPMEIIAHIIFILQSCFSFSFCGLRSFQYLFTLHPLYMSIKDASYANGVIHTYMDVTSFT